MEARATGPLKLAAIVYDDGVAVDALMAEFARELRESGIHIAGILQMPPAESGCGPAEPMHLLDLCSGETICICQNLGPGAKSCKLDVAALAEAAGRLREAADKPCDLLMVSKFGKQEAAGRGFRAEIAHAASEGQVVLTAVKRGMVHNWLEFTGGCGTLLDHRLWVLRDWWMDIQNTYMRAAA